MFEAATSVSAVFTRDNLVDDWSRFFYALHIPIECQKPARTKRGRIILPFYLSRQQTSVVVSELYNRDYEDVYAEVADSSSFPLIWIIGRPEIGHYRVRLFPPKHNRRFYYKMTRAQFAEGRDDDRRLWLIQDGSHFKLQKIWQMSQTVGPRPNSNSDWLRRAFRSVQCPSIHKTLELPVIVC